MRHACADVADGALRQTDERLRAKQRAEEEALQELLRTLPPSFRDAVCAASASARQVSKLGDANTALPAAQASALPWPLPAALQQWAEQEDALSGDAGQSPASTQAAALLLELQETVRQLEPAVFAGVQQPQALRPQPAVMDAAAAPQSELQACDTAALEERPRRQGKPKELPVFEPVSVDRFVHRLAQARDMQQVCLPSRAGAAACRRVLTTARVARACAHAEDGQAMLGHGRRVDRGAHSSAPLPPHLLRGAPHRGRHTATQLLAAERQRRGGLHALWPPPRLG